MGFLKRLFGQEDRLAQPLCATSEEQFKERFAGMNGPYFERVSATRLSIAVEAGEVEEQRAQLLPDHQPGFMMGYSCCMMWAIKSGLEKVLEPAQVEPIVTAMERHLAQKAWYQVNSFEKIWARTQVMMPVAMNASYGPNASPPLSRWRKC